MNTQPSGSHRTNYRHYDRLLFSLLYTITTKLAVFDGTSRGMRPPDTVSACHGYGLMGIRIHHLFTRNGPHGRSGSDFLAKRGAGFASVI